MGVLCAVMEGYQELYPHAAHAWRTWQGTLSGKAGVTFEEKGCGSPMGEKGYGDLKKKVSTPPPPFPSPHVGHPPPYVWTHEIRIFNRAGGAGRCTAAAEWSGHKALEQSCSRVKRVAQVDSGCRLSIVPLFHGSSSFESFILSHHSRFTCEQYI